MQKYNCMNEYAASKTSALNTLIKWSNLAEHILSVSIGL